MHRLYHHPLDAPSRMLRLALMEKDLPFAPIVENFWERREEFMALNAAGEVPVLVSVQSGTERVLADACAIAEYLEEIHPRPNLLGTTAEGRAEVRRLVSWFTRKFHDEVTHRLVGEKIFKRLTGRGEPDSNALRSGYAAIHHHLDYIGFLAERRNWLGGETITLGDLAAAAEISTIDYLGDVPWDRYPAAHDWYARIKSRPAFRGLLSDRLPGLPPPQHYANLDF